MRSPGHYYHPLSRNNAKSADGGPAAGRYLVCSFGDEKLPVSRVFGGLDNLLAASADLTA
jgi:hypothetical protein